MAGTFSWDDLVLAPLVANRALHGKGIRPGVEIKNTTNLDIAPTLLALMGIPVPAIVKGRVMSEAWGEAPAPRVERVDINVS